MQWKIVRRENLYQGFFQMDRVHVACEDHQGHERTYAMELFERGQAVGIIPYDPELDAVVMVQQFRIGALDAPEGPWLWEFPAGMVAQKESPETAARRELLEETGLVPTTLQFIQRFWVSPGGTSESIHLFYAEVDARNAEGVYGNAEEDEHIYAKAMPCADLFARLDQGEISSAPTIIGAQWLRLRHGTHRA